MKVIMKTLAAGPDGIVFPGQGVTLAKEDAQATVDGGFGQYETTAVEIPEKREAEKQVDEKAPAKAPKKRSKKK